MTRGRWFAVLALVGVVVVAAGVVGACAQSAKKHHDSSGGNKHANECGEVMQGVYDQCGRSETDAHGNPMSKSQAVNDCESNWNKYGGCLFGCLKGATDCDSFGVCFNDCVVVGTDHASECGLVMSALYEQCQQSLTEGGNPLSENDAAQYCVQNWSAVGGCWYGCDRSTTDCPAYENCLTECLTIS